LLRQKNFVLLKLGNKKDRKMPATIQRIGLTILLAAVIGIFPSCSDDHNPATDTTTTKAKQKTIGVLLVNHGSRSLRWREMLLAVESQVREEITALDSIRGLKTAFMEYNEPSIATQLKAFDEEGVSDIILVPLLLRVSTHSFDDIPTIIGSKEDAMSKASLKSDGIERYTPRAHITTTPLLDYATLLRKNIVRRVMTMSSNPADEGVVLVAYGSRAYDKEWQQLLTELSTEISIRTGIEACTHAWCGHLVKYSQLPTMDAISEIMQTKDRALVVPLLVAEDEFFQGEIIGGAVHQSGFGDRVVYRGDSVLPDENLNRWVVEIVTETVNKITAGDMN